MSIRWVREPAGGHLRLVLDLVHRLRRRRSWLAHAVEATEPQSVAHFKAFIATVAESTKQLNLSKEIQLNAQEMVRRAERGVGKAIRKGQEEGTVRRTGQRTGNQHTKPEDLVDNQSSKASVYDFASTDDLTGNGAGIYHMTDGVSDEQFDEAIAEAKAERNLSMRNVIRKVQGPGHRPEHSQVAGREGRRAGRTRSQLPAAER